MKSIDEAQARDRRRLLQQLPAVLAAWAPALPAQTPWPVRPLRWVVPFAPGGGADVIARLVAPTLSIQLSTPIVIDNRPGASGTIGSDAVARGADDGHTALMSNNASMATAPAVYPKLGYEALRDFVHVFMIGSFANALLVRADHSVKSLSELLQLAKRKPGMLTFASAGTGSAGHLTGELLKIKAGIDLQHVPYKGTGPAITDLLAGHIDALFDGLPASLNYIRSGKLRALAVSSQQRLPMLPDTPTLAETVEGVYGSAWFGLSMPAKTPREVVRKLESAGRRCMDDAVLRQRLLDIGVLPSGLGEAEYTALVKSEIARWAPVIREAKVRAE